MRRLTIIVSFLAMGAVMAQDFFIGDPITAGLEQFGVMNVYDAEMGKQFHGNGGVYAWNGVKVTDNAWRQYSLTSTPTNLTSYTTNAFGALYFESDNTPGTVHMRNDAWGKLATGSSNFTLAFLVCAQTNNSNSRLFGFGWSASTNNNASRFDVRPNSSTLANSVIGIAQDTNQAIVQITVNSSVVTNIYKWVVASKSGNTYSLLTNLRAGAGTSDGAYTSDEASLGCTVRNAVNTESFWRGSVTVAAMFTNGYTGTSLTNLSNYLNNNYRNGRYRVY